MVDPDILTSVGAQFGFAGLVAALLLWCVLAQLRTSLNQMVTLQRQMLVTLVLMCERLKLPERDRPTGATEEAAHV